MRDMAQRCAWAAVCAVVIGSGAAAWADDIVPAPWRFSGLFTLQDWEFHTPGGPLPPDGDSVPINPNGTALASPGAGVAWTPDFSSTGLDGYVGAGTPDSFIDFDIPNFIDFEPVKWIRVQINGDWSAAVGVPTVIDITSFDNVVGGATTFGFDASDETFPGFHRWEDWHVIPNPDFEVIRLFVPTGAFVNQVLIETTSIPEPAALVLVAVGILAVGVRLGRRA